MRPTSREAALESTFTLTVNGRPSSALGVWQPEEGRCTHTNQLGHRPITQPGSFFLPGIGRAHVIRGLSEGRVREMKGSGSRAQVSPSPSS